MNTSVLLVRITNHLKNLKIMEAITRDLFVSIAAFAGIFGIVYVFLMTRYRERMSMLERGIDPSQFASRGNSKSLTLKLGMLCIGIAMGILAGNLLYKNDWLDKPVSYLSMVFLFGGTSLILNFIIDRKIKN
jgi:ABC-type antimicrobial peptide transport system permease subunit